MPSVGYDTDLSPGGTLNHRLRAVKVTLPAYSICSKLTVFIWWAESGARVKAAIYEDSGGAPGALVYEVPSSHEHIFSDDIGDTSVEFDISAAAVKIGPGDYWIVAWGYDGSVSFSHIPAGTVGKYRIQAYAANFPDPFGAVSSVYPIGIILEYDIYTPYTFTRASLGFEMDAGAEVANNIPRFSTSFYGTGIPIEIAVTNLVPASDSISLGAGYVSCGTLNGDYLVSCVTGSVTIKIAGVVQSDVAIPGIHVEINPTTQLVEVAGPATLVQVADGKGCGAIKSWQKGGVARVDEQLYFEAGKIFGTNPDYLSFELLIQSPNYFKDYLLYPTIMGSFPILMQLESSMPNHLQIAIGVLIGTPGYLRIAWGDVAGAHNCYVDIPFKGDYPPVSFYIAACVDFAKGGGFGKLFLYVRDIINGDEAKGDDSSTWGGMTLSSTDKLYIGEMPSAAFDFRYPRALYDGLRVSNTYLSSSEIDDRCDALTDYGFNQLADTIVFTNFFGEISDILPGGADLLIAEMNAYGANFITMDTGDSKFLDINGDPIQVGNPYQTHYIADANPNELGIKGEDLLED